MPRYWKTYNRAFEDWGKQNKESDYTYKVSYNKGPILAHKDVVRFKVEMYANESPLGAGAGLRRLLVLVMDEN